MAEGNDERSNRENNGMRPNGYNGNRNNRRHHRSHRYNGNQNRYNNNANGQKREEGEQPVEGGNRQEASHYPRRDFSRHTEPVKAHETVEDIRKDMMRIEKEIELEVSEIAALKLGI